MQSWRVGGRGLWLQQKNSGRSSAALQTLGCFPHYSQYAVVEGHYCLHPTPGLDPYSAHPGLPPSPGSTVLAQPDQGVKVPILLFWTSQLGVPGVTYPNLRVLQLDHLLPSWRIWANQVGRPMRVLDGCWRQRAAIQQAGDHLSENGQKILGLKGQVHVVDGSERGRRESCDGSLGGRGRQRRRKDKWMMLR